MKNKKGFTVAELLLTMGIIGIISAIMLPTLGKAKPNQELIMFKKAYYNTTRIVAELINDDDLYPERDDDADGSRSGFSNTSIKDMLDGETEAKYHGKTYEGASKFCGLFAAKMGIEDADCSTLKRPKDGGNFTTTDGMLWGFLGNFTNGNNTAYVIVDVNGKSKGDNCSTTQNISGVKCTDNQIPDTFAFIIGRYGDVRIYEDLGKKYIECNNVNKEYKEFK